MTAEAGRVIHVTGVVQGVGFRPFVYGLAQQHGLTGWVRNTSAGVDIVVNGRPVALHAFLHSLQYDLPPLARIDTYEVNECPVDGFTEFEIVPSTAVPGAFQPISPDVCICLDCLRELFDPTDRRYRYPFINCTHCGPRLTIIQDIPYDRPNTTMAPFLMCPECQREYDDPRDRRFHAQPVACPVCGPRVWLLVNGQSIDEHYEQSSRGDAETGCCCNSRYQREKSVKSAESVDFSESSTDYPLHAARQLLAEGYILAVKGLGGFHLACDARNDKAVMELRRRKLRVDKPFALMMPDVDTVERYCFVNEAERELLHGRERPIVLLRRRPDTNLSSHIAPGQYTVGVMLPYTPLHYLLLDHSLILVMTSGNMSEEPIAYTNEEALTRLSALADAFLLHNRDIHVRCDDSVMRVLELPAVAGVRTGPQSGGQIKKPSPSSRPLRSARPSRFTYPLRRSRGYAPDPIQLTQPLPHILATGAELKNAFCLTRDHYAFMSHHIGDLENYDTLRSFEEGIVHFERLFRIKPELIAYDKHPDYLATRYARERAEREEVPAVGVQHHHAHVAACMAEHGLLDDQPVIGVALDGTGYGEDGTIWGGEFLVADYGGFQRPYHLAPMPLPGGDTAVRQPWRFALAALYQARIAWDEALPPVRQAIANRQTPISAIDVVRHQLETGLNAPLTSSMGRLFDAVAALIGVRQVINYEAQAAVELEALAHEAGLTAALSTGYPFAISDSLIDPAPLLSEIVKDWRRGVGTAVIAARFHVSVAQMVTAVCQRIRQQTGLTHVVLSGGVWQNMTLLQLTIPFLQTAGFTTYFHQRLPANDGGLALGQAVIAARSL